MDSAQYSVRWGAVLRPGWEVRKTHREESGLEYCSHEQIQLSVTKADDPLGLCVRRAMNRHSRCVFLCHLPASVTQDVVSEYAFCGHRSRMFAPKAFVDLVYV